MSLSSLPGSRTADETGGPALSLHRSVLEPAKAIAFWAAVALPFLYLPLLATGLERPVTIVAFLSLLMVNGVALLVGHPHGQD